MYLSSDGAEAVFQRLDSPKKKKKKKKALILRGQKTESYSFKSKGVITERCIENRVHTSF